MEGYKKVAASKTVEKLAGAKALWEQRGMWTGVMEYKL